MKKLLLLAALCIATVSLHAQGTVSFSNSGLANAYKISYASDGTFISGATFRIGLYAGSAGTAEGALSLVGLATNAAPAAAAGYFNGGNPFTVNGLGGAGTAITFQLRAWSLAGGATYEEALASGNPAYFAGRSTVGTTTLGGGTTPAGVLWTTTNPLGVTGFSVAPVPEPSSIALGLLGLGAVALFRRRK